MRNLQVRRSSAFKRSVGGPGRVARGGGEVRKWGDAAPPAAPKTGWAAVLDYVGDIFTRGGAGSVQKDAAGGFNTRELFGVIQTKFGSALTNVSYDDFATTLAKNADVLGIGISLREETAYSKATRNSAAKKAPPWGDPGNTAFVEREIAGTTDSAVNLSTLYAAWVKLLTDKKRGIGPTVAKNEWIDWAGKHLQSQELGRFIPEKSLFIIEEGPALTQKRFEKRLGDLEAQVGLIVKSLPEQDAAALEAAPDDATDVTAPPPSETDERREVINTLAEVAGAMKAMKEEFATQIADLKKGARRGGDNAFTPAPSAGGLKFGEFAKSALSVA